MEVPKMLPWFQKMSLNLLMYYFLYAILYRTKGHMNFRPPSPSCSNKFEVWYSIFKQPLTVLFIIIRVLPLESLDKDFFLPLGSFFLVPNVTRRFLLPFGMVIKFPSRDSSTDRRCTQRCTGKRERHNPRLSQEKYGNGEKSNYKYTHPKKST